MRHIICIEGDEKVPGQYILPNALSWPSGKQRISFNFNWHEEAIGWAKDICREEDGSITAEIELLPEYEGVIKDMPEHCYSIYMQPAEFHSWKDVIWVTKAFIKGLALIPQAFWPKEPIK